MPDVEKCVLFAEASFPTSELSPTTTLQLSHVLSRSTSSVGSSSFMPPRPCHSVPCPLPPNDIDRPQPTDSEHEPSEGGLRAHLTVFGAFTALLCTFGQMNSFGTYQTWYHAKQLHHLSPSTISWIGSLQLWVFFFSGGPIGQLFDRFGPRWLIASGSLIFIFSIMMTSLSSQYYQYILTQGILFGLGVGLLFYPSLASVSTYFRKYRATALGIAAAGSSVGGVVYPIMLQHLFVTVGFGWGVRISGLVSAACCVTAVLTITSHITPKRARKSEPEEEEEEAGGEVMRVTIKTFSDIQYILLAIGCSLVALGLFIPFFYIVEYGRHLSLSPSLTSYLLAIVNAGGVFGRIAPAYLSDSLGRFNLLVPSAFLSGVSCLALWLPLTRATPPALLVLFAALYGFFSGAFISVITPCVAQISDMRQIGVRIGVLYSVISFPSLIGGPAAGALLSRAHGSYNDMIIFAGTTIVAGSLFIMLARLSLDSRIFVRI